MIKRTNLRAALLGAVAVAALGGNGRGPEPDVGLSGLCGPDHG